MSWTYDSTAPGSSGKSYVRLRIGDVSSGSQLLQDEEIEVFLTAETNWLRAAALAARSVAGSFSRKTDKTVGKLSIKAGSASGYYSDLAADLMREADRKAGAYAGGISIADMDETRDDTDSPTPAFERGQFDNPGTDSTGALS